MLTEEQIERMLLKLRRFQETLEKLIFEKVGEAENVRAFETAEDYHEIPAADCFKPAEKGFQWGGESHYCWYTTEYKVPSSLSGQDLFLWPHISGYEALLWVNGVPFGTFANKIVFTGHGNHYCDMIRKNAKKGEVLSLAVEYYAGHSYKGCAPLENLPLLDYQFRFDSLDICVKNHDISDFYFDLLTVTELADALPKSSERRGELINALYQVHNTVYYSYDDIDRETFTAALQKAHPFLKAELAKKNGDCVSHAGLIGHSHMDTAWLWHMGETVKKCARTYSNELNLMEQYPEYTFIQSSALHSEFIRRYYPELFKRIQKRVAEGRYEPNGGVWVECDCNITSGESMIRQFLWGQRFTRKYFNFTSNCFWLPDTFGYSAAIPQIMKGCGVDYFLTTKIDWNDTNRFPYQTFWWEGIDGTRVFSHFNRTHMHPDPKGLIETIDGAQGLLEKSVSNKRLISYGFGDGGGGPQFEMIEEARRCKDLAGCPTAEHTTVGAFMKDLEKTAVNPSTYRGELYLEIHRGTLTNQHKIKRNNRKCELALRDTEILTVADAVQNHKKADSEKIHPLYETLLKNQFHDVLPGTCIPRAHKESKEQTDAILASCKELKSSFTDKNGSGNEITLTNTLSFDRRDPQIIHVKKGFLLDGDFCQQRYTDLDGNDCLIVCGLHIPAFSSVTLKLKKGEPENGSSFKESKTGVTTPFAKIRFDKKGAISSFSDLQSGREIRGDGYPLNTFLIAEDLPSAWDNWDIDADLEGKFKDTAVLLSREKVSDGKAALVLRSTYRLTPKTTLTQDMFFFSSTKEVRFDTLMDWNDDHRFLKTAFDTSVYQDFARFEIQFGCAKRPTTRNTSVEKAKFEVLNHKYTDLSETRFGVSILNDCKYGISAEGGRLRLSLHKGGTRPDFTGDHGLHRCVYSLLPHEGDFSADRVTRPAYELNIPCIQSSGEYRLPALIVPQESNIIVECLKPCEDAEKAFIARLYECEGTRTVTALRLFDGVKKAEVTNMLEEPTGEILDPALPALTFHPFEIKTLKISY